MVGARPTRSRGPCTIMATEASGTGRAAPGRDAPRVDGSRIPVSGAGEAGAARLIAAARAPVDAFEELSTGRTVTGLENGRAVATTHYWYLLTMLSQLGIPAAAPAAPMAG